MCQSVKCLPCKHCLELEFQNLSKKARHGGTCWQCPNPGLGWWKQIDSWGSLISQPCLHNQIQASERLSLTVKDRWILRFTSGFLVFVSRCVSMCVCVCVCACACVCVSVCLHVNMCVCVSVCLCVCACVCMLCVCTCVCVCITQGRMDLLWLSVWGYI